MHQVLLNNTLTLSFEPLGKKVRLIISEDDAELACRKETIKNLKHFLTEDETKIFKGRLQLNKQGDIIEVLLKNKPIAVVSSIDFEQILNKL
ncbi:hypothetical protein GM921_06060 [Pedobacter sp. LMG 31464]|uniref:Uncharacterized protein n=1 Tax=Pedobacter planticolens TaxID=2679964 RepID=A0A923DYZ4_9SPHI|nr:hypothetical protein [Pedobacter planticolens]MBB2145038.1 hypothetical protein [Pedobacter planticolens]